MRRYYYDLHLHSCLSPCGDMDMTPNNIAGMAKLSGLDIVALTDHNSCLNCPAFFEACERYGVIPVAGMELTTAEDIHVVCLFETLEAAMLFNEEVAAHRIRIGNRPEIFGQQLILNGMDEPIGTEADLLINATDLTLEEVPAVVKKYGGVCYPAHIDRESNGIITALGTFPESPDFRLYELHDGSNRESYLERFPVLRGKACVVSSDAHYLEHMREGEGCFELPEGTAQQVRKELFERLRG